MALFKKHKSDETELVQLVRKGDENAMHELYSSYVGRLAAITSRYITSEEDVKDILQESFLKIFNGIDKFEYRGEGSLRAWMSKITLNETLKYIRRNCRVDMTDADLSDMNIPQEDPDTEDIPPGVIHNMIRQLPDGYRAVFNLYVIEGKSHKEIAELLGIKENSSASQLHRAKAILAEQIRQYKER